MTRSSQSRVTGYGPRVVPGRCLPIWRLRRFPDRARGHDVRRPRTWRSGPVCRWVYQAAGFAGLIWLYRVPRSPRVLVARWLAHWAEAALLTGTRSRWLARWTEAALAGSHPVSSAGGR